MKKLILAPFVILTLRISVFLASLLINTFSNSGSTVFATSNKETIVLDAGHGGYDVGCIALDGTYEKDITLNLTLQIGDILEENGYNVVYTRTSDNVSWPEDNEQDLQARVDIAQEADADYFVSIHINSSNYNDGASGFETYVNFSDETMVSMANSIHTYLSNLNYTQDRGLYDAHENPLYVLVNNNVPALLLEVGFITDSNDAWYMENEDEALSEAIANGIITSLQEETNDTIE